MKKAAHRITKCLIIGMLALQCSWMAHADITTGLVLNYQFTEGSGTNIADASGNGNHAFLYNNGYSGWAPGLVGGSILMNTNPAGSNFDPDYIQTASNVTLANQTNFTFAFWAKALPYNPLYNPRFFATPSTSGGTHWVLWQPPRGVGIYSASMPVGTVPSTDGWHHFAVTYNPSTGAFTDYVDGVSQGSGSQTKGAPGAVRWIIGHNENTAATYEGDEWKGYLSDVRMYNRILSVSDIGELVALAPQPVVIDQNPQDVTCYEGEPFTLNVTLTSGTLPSYQWWRDTTMITEATNASLTISLPTTSDAGNYTVVISNSVGVVTSTPPAVVTITPVTNPLTTALVLNYQFNEGSGTAITDSSGNGNNATLFNSDWAAWAPGRVGGAIVMNTNPPGSNYDPCYIQTDVNVLLASQDKLSFAFWAKALPYGTLANPRFFAIPGSHWVLWQSPRGVGFWSATPTTVQPSTDFWHHFAVTYNRPAGTYTVYVDGVAMGNGSGSVRTAPGEVQWIIGHAENTDQITEGDTWKGYLSDVRMYNRLLRPSDISAIVALAPTVAPSITRQPQDTTSYATTSLILSVSADGTQPINYQWYKDGSPVSGAISATYRVDGVTTNNTGSYTVAAWNTAGSVTSAPPAVVTVLIPPTTGYMAAVLADAPEAYWRMDDTDSTLRDTMGRHPGTYQGAVSQGTPGVLTGDSSPCVTFGGSANYASVPASTNFNGTYTSGDFSMEVWASLQAGASGLKTPFYTRSAADGVNFYCFDATTQPPAPTWAQIQWGKNNGTTWGATPVNNIAPRDDSWNYYVCTYNKAANTLNFYYNGVLVGSDNNANFTLLQNPNVPIQIGGAGSYDWPGNVDEAAWYNKTLSSDRILAHYNLAKYGDSAPLGILTEPQSQTVVVGWPAQISVQPDGLPPFHYQWLKNGAPIAGQNQSTLSFASAYFTDAGNYSVSITNNAGSTNSAVAVLTVIPQPSYAQVTNGLVVHLTFDGDYNDYSGRGNSATAVGTPDFVPGIIGNEAVHYSADTGASSYNYVSLLDTNAMTGAWPDLLFGGGEWSAAYWVRATNVSLLPFLSNGQGSQGFTCASASPGPGTEVRYTGGFYWAVPNVVADGQWHHIANIKQADTHVLMYIDGVSLLGPQPVHPGTVDTANPFNIGQNGLGTLAQDGSGVMDDLGMWNRALTPLEVYTLVEVGMNYGRSLNQVAPVKLNLQQVGTNLDLSWQAGTLLSSDKATSGYLPVQGATSPFYRTTASGTAKFFRVQQ